MDVNASETEKSFSTLHTALGTFVFSMIDSMQKEIVSLREQNSKLNEKLKSLQPEPSINDK